VLVLDHLGSGVHFLLSLLSTSSKSENKMKGSLLGDIVVAERTSVLELCMCLCLEKYQNDVRKEKYRNDVFRKKENVFVCR
jgi:hypothetical protein